jgi:hypothetical protein
MKHNRRAIENIYDPFSAPLTAANNNSSATTTTITHELKVLYHF